MTDTDRKYLARQLEHFEALDAKIDALCKPHEEAIAPLRGIADAVAGLREDMLERHLVSISGKCESCSKVLFAGDKACVGDDYMECEACAGTYAEALKISRKIAADGEDSEAAEIAAHIEKLIADGTVSPDEKYVIVLPA